jgi:hypothetical protein
MRGLAFLCALGVLTSTGGLHRVAVAAPSAPKKLLDYHAYASWRTVREVKLSRDGTWLAYAAVPNQADGELIARQLTSTTEYREPRGRAPVFSADARFVVYRIAAPIAEVKAAAKNPDLADDKKPKDGLGILDLRTGSATTVERVRSFLVARDGATLVYRREPLAAASPSASPSVADAVSRNARERATVRRGIERSVSVTFGLGRAGAQSARERQGHIAGDSAIGARRAVDRRTRHRIRG